MRITLAEEQTARRNMALGQSPLFSLFKDAIEDLFPKFTFSPPAVEPQQQVPRVSYEDVAKEVAKRYGGVQMVPLDLAYDLVRDIPREVIDKTYPDKEALQRIAFWAVVTAEVSHRNNPAEPIPLDELTRRLATGMVKQAIAFDEGRIAAGR